MTDRKDFAQLDEPSPKTLTYTPKGADALKEEKPKRKKNKITKRIIGSKGFTSVPNELVRRLKSDGAIFLMKLVGWLDFFKNNRPREIIDGFFPVSVKDIYDDLGLSYEQQDRLTKKLERLGLIDSKVETRSMLKERVFNVNVDAIIKLIEDEKQSAGSGFSDKRFNRKADKSVPVSYRKHKDGLSENTKTDLVKTQRRLYRETTLETALDSSSHEKNQAWAAPAGRPPSFPHSHNSIDETNEHPASEVESGLNGLDTDAIPAKVDDFDILGAIDEILESEHPANDDDPWAREMLEALNKLPDFAETPTTSQQTEGVPSLT